MNLPHLAPDPDRAERVRQRCRAQLTKRHQPRARRQFPAMTFERAVISGISVLYLAAVGLDAINIFLMR